MSRRIRDPRAPERIVEAAARVVATEGVHGATVRAIAAEAGVSTGYLTHYFEDKHRLMVELLRHTNSRSARRVLKAAGRGPAFERLRAAIEAVLPLDAERRRAWQVWVAVWSVATPPDELGHGLRAGWAGLRAILVDLLEQARAEGSLRSTVDVAEEAERLVTVLAGLGLLAGVESQTRVRRAASRLVEDQLAGLKPARAA